MTAANLVSVNIGAHPIMFGATPLLFFAHFYAFSPYRLIHSTLTLHPYFPQFPFNVPLYVSFRLSSSFLPRVLMVIKILCGRMQ